MAQLWVRFTVIHAATSLPYKAVCVWKSCGCVAEEHFTAFTYENTHQTDSYLEKWTMSLVDNQQNGHLVEWILFYLLIF